MPGLRQNAVNSRSEIATIVIITDKCSNHRFSAPDAVGSNIVERRFVITIVWSNTLHDFSLLVLVYFCISQKNTAKSYFFSSEPENRINSFAFLIQLINFLGMKVITLPIRYE